MSYSDLRNQINQRTLEVTSTQDYYKVYFNSDLHSKLSKLEGQFVYHLFNDLSGTEVNKDLKTFLNSFYGIAEEYAKDCVHSAFYSSHIHGLKIKNWTDSALKCFDCMLMKLVNEVLKDKMKSTSIIKERDIYQHLISKTGNLYTVGISFDTIYQQRNEFTHVQIQDINGIRRPRPLSTKKLNVAKSLILEQFNKGLTALINEIP